MKSLIVYATKYGCTEKCAEILKEKLGGPTDVHRLGKKDKIDLSDYDTVILGSSVYMGRIRKEMREFCKNNLDRLTSKKIGLFICCADRNAPMDELKGNYPAELVSRASAMDFFGAMVQLNKLGAFDRFIYKKVTKMTAKEGTPEATGIVGDINDIQEDRIERFAAAMKSPA